MVALIVPATVKLPPMNELPVTPIPPNTCRELPATDELEAAVDLNVAVLFTVIPPLDTQLGAPLIKLPS